VQATHLAISSPALLNFVRAYLWQLERTGAIPDGDNEEEQRAAKEAARALISEITRREQLWPLFAEFKQYVEHHGMGGAVSERLQAVLTKLQPQASVARPSQPVEAAPPIPAPEPAVDSVDDAAVPRETESSAAAGDEPDIEPASDAGSDPSVNASDDVGTDVETSSGGDSSSPAAASRRRGRR
jgi:hypothetical protein